MNTVMTPGGRRPLDHAYNLILLEICASGLWAILLFQVIVRRRRHRFRLAVVYSPWFAVRKKQLSFFSIKTTSYLNFYPKHNTRN